MHTNLIKDALYNTSKELVKNRIDVHYCRGIIVGLVTGLMSKGMQFDTAIKLIKSCLPNNYDPDCFPHSWRD